MSNIQANDSNIHYLTQDLPFDIIKDLTCVAIDTESTGLHLQRDKLCLVQVYDGNKDVYVVKINKGDDIKGKSNLRRLLADANVKKIMHYGRFDMAMIYKHFDIMLENVYCTKIASHLVRTYTDQHSLKNLVKELLSQTMDKRAQSSDWAQAELSEEQIKYSAEDVLYLHGLRQKLDIMLKREGRYELAEECFRFLSSRVKLDLLGWNDIDIFAHRM